MRLLALVAAGVLLAGCAGAPKRPPEPIIITKEVKVPVAVSCVPDKLGAEPAYVDSDDALRAAASAEDRFQLLYAGRKQRVARAAEVEPVIKTCRKAGN